jgi:hypothetical protein
MKENYTMLERVLLNVFGLYLLATAGYILNLMMQSNYSNTAIFLTVGAFTLMWLVGGVLIPTIIKAYEFNTIMRELGDTKEFDQLIKKIKKGKKK